MTNTTETTSTDEPHLKVLAADEDFWDYLDELEVEYGAVREWDNAVVGGSR